jgi:hypothetical protein
MRDGTFGINEMFSEDGAANTTRRRRPEGTRLPLQSDKLQINGRNESNTAFEAIVVVQHIAAWGNIGLRTASQFGAGRASLRLRTQWRLRQ